MADFKKNVTNISNKDRDKYFQLPQDIKKYVDKKDRQKYSLEHTKKRLEEQLEVRQKYISLLEDAYSEITLFIENHDGQEPSDDIYEKNLTLATIYEEIIVKVAKFKVEAHNLEIEITAQKNVFVDSYIYYKEDFIKKQYEKGLDKKKSVFKKKK